MLYLKNLLKKKKKSLLQTSADFIVTAPKRPYVTPYGRLLLTKADIQFETRIARPMKLQPTTTEKQAHRSMEGLRVAGQVVVHDHKAKQLYGAVQQRIDLTENRQVLKEKGNNELGVYGAVDHEEDGEQLAVEAVVLGKVAHHFDQSFKVEDA
ncbi:hypothetical protein TYRP_021239 [Tyrophagus putrescentiae]|nr:hypothetical protein TYRP_021239 [Tyrophagus putrescentiae]